MYLHYKFTKKNPIKVDRFSQHIRDIFSSSSNDHFIKSFSYFFPEHIIKSPKYVPQHAQTLTKYKRNLLKIPIKPVMEKINFKE